MSDSLSAQTSSQWQRLLKNSGTWEGSFTQFSTDGQVISDVLTEVELMPTNEGQSMHQEVRRYSPGEPPSIQAFDYSSINRATMFFENGAFSQGSIQWAPFSTFGAELGLIAAQERSRLFVLFDSNGQLKTITLIREVLKGTIGSERAAFRSENLIGTWQGGCTTLFADLRPEEKSNFQQTTEWSQDNQIHELTWMINDADLLPTVGSITGQTIDFYSGTSQTSRLIMLPDGCFCRCPMEAKPRETPLFVELGWMIGDRIRQRIRRTYDATGAWATLLLFTEQRVGS